MDQTNGATPTMRNNEAQITKVAHSPRSAAAAAHIGVNAIYNALNSGSLKAKKLGNRTIITDEDLRQFLVSLPDYPSQQTTWTKKNAPCNRGAVSARESTNLLIVKEQNHDDITRNS